MTRGTNIIVRTLLISSSCVLATSCTMQYTCADDASSIALANPKVRHGASMEERVSAYLPGGVRKSGFEVTHIDSIREGGSCGNPLLVTVMTFGVVPSSIPTPFTITVTGKENDRKQTRKYGVAMTGTYSAWNALTPGSSDDKALARGILHAIDRDQQLRSGSRDRSR